jgi:hypothetical protein
MNWSRTWLNTSQTIISLSTLPIWCRLCPLWQDITLRCQDNPRTGQNTKELSRKWANHMCYYFSHLWYVDVCCHVREPASQLSDIITDIQIWKMANKAHICTSKTTWNTHSSKIDTELPMSYTMTAYAHNQFGKESSTQAQPKQSRIEQKVNPPHSLLVLATIHYQMSHVALCCDKSDIETWKVTKKWIYCELH